MKRIFCSFISLLLILSFIAVPVNCAAASGTVTFDDINSESVFFNQHTSVTCTLASAAMLMRRTAIISGYSDWEEITEENIRGDAWIDGIGLLWNFTSYDIKIGHGYFSGSDNKAFMLELLHSNPQGVVIYNGGNSGQSHAVLLTDYDEKNDVFYVADPSNAVSPNRITLMESTIVGENQDEKIANISSYWYVVSPTVKFSDGVFTSDYSGGGSGAYDPASDTAVFNNSKTAVNKYFVVTDDAAKGSALRFYPSGSSSTASYEKKGAIIYVSYSGKNSSGAMWYKTGNGYYIYSDNLVEFGSYSAEVKKFKNTSKDVNNTYKVKASSGTKTPLRIEPSEGNNIVAYAENDTLLYIAASGVNSVGASWLRTGEGYYVKKSEMEYVSAGKMENSDFNGETMTITGSYSSSPVEDSNPGTVLEAKKYVVNASSGLNMRESADINGRYILTIPNKTQVTVTEVLDGWGKTQYNGKTGWISLEYVIPLDEYAEPLKIEQIKLNNDRIETGKAVTCLVTASGGKGGYSYKAALYNDANKVIGIFSSEDATLYLSYKTETAGVYYFYVELTDSADNSVYAYSRSFTVCDLLQIESVMSDVDEFTYVSDQITWSVETISTSDSALYNFTVYRDGKKVYNNRQASPELKYIPKTAGIYVVSVVLENDYSQSKTIESESVVVYKKLSIDSIKLSASSVLSGQSVKCSVSATGGAGDYRYCFSLFRSDSLVRNGAFGDADSFEYTFTQSGNYTFFCAVIDSTNMIISAFSEEIAVRDIVMGDVDGDGHVTASDARIVLRAAAKLVSLTENTKIAADVDNDGKVTVADARHILRRVAKLE